MLFLREVKKVVCSISYVLFVIVIVADLYSQGVLPFYDNKISEPQIGGNYGTTQREIPELIMPAALEKLWGEFCENDYRTYPIGIIKHVKLNDKKQAEIAEIISEITGVDKDIIFKAQDDKTSVGNSEFVIQMGEDIQIENDNKLTFSQADITEEQELSFTVRSDMEYDQFKKFMQQVDDILGGGSDYNADSLIGFGTVSLDYEEAVKRYHLVVNKDKITGGYARLFSDYAVTMAMSILPVFLTVILCGKDRQEKMTELIFIRKVSSAKLIIARYTAIVTTAMLPMIILSYHSNISVWGMYRDMELDYLAPLKYDFGWIMPSVMIVTAIGMCLTELTNTPIAVVVQGFWWLIDVNTGMQSVSDNYALFRLAPRHNAGTMSYFRTQDYIDNFRRLLANRLLFAGLSVVFIAMTILLYETKRRGKFHGNYAVKRTISNIRSRKNKFET